MKCFELFCLVLHLQFRVNKRKRSVDVNGGREVCFTWVNRKQRLATNSFDMTFSGYVSRGSTFAAAVIGFFNNCVEFHECTFLRTFNRQVPMKEVLKQKGKSDLWSKTKGQTTKNRRCNLLYFMHKSLCFWKFLWNGKMFKNSYFCHFTISFSYIQ